MLQIKNFAVTFSNNTKQIYITIFKKNKKKEHCGQICQINYLVEQLRKKNNETH